MTDLGYQNHLHVRNLLLEQVVGDMNAGIRASQNYYGLGHFALFPYH